MIDLLTDTHAQAVAHWRALIDMGGYAFYVWGSVLATFAALGLEAWLLRRRTRRALLALREAAWARQAGETLP